jgi:glycosyltransferase involved in cell wall biosynthesis
MKEMSVTSVSVAMATYNGARFIREQLDSIAAQTILPAELVITDDASSDDTIAIVRAFAGTVPFPVHIHENPVRLGYRANFMRNVGLCTSELIALCDQDDIWAPYKLERALESFEDPDVLLSFHEAWLIDSLGARIGLAQIFPQNPKSPALSLFPLQNPYGFSMLFRRRLLEFSNLWECSVDNILPHTKMAHDQWFFFLASAFGTIAYVEAPLAGYRQHENNTYGLERPARTIRERIHRWIHVRSKEYAMFTVAAETRASIMNAARDRLDDAWRAKAHAAAQRYRTLARHCELRAAVYGAPSMASRLAAWFAMLRDGAYGNRTRWTFGRKAVLRDFSYLILPRWLLARLVPSRSTARAD